MIKEKEQKASAGLGFLDQIHETEHRWFAVHTRYKGEKFVRDALEKKHITAYVPLRTNLRVYGTRKRTSEIPVISCYVFVKIVSADQVKVLETEHVLAFVRSGKNRLAIPEEEMNLLKRIVLDEDLDWTIEPGFTLETGHQVTVSAGALAGMSGKVIKADGKEKFVVELQTLGHSIYITVDAKYLTRI